MNSLLESIKGLAKTAWVHGKSFGAISALEKVNLTEPIEGNQDWNYFVVNILPDLVKQLNMEQSEIQGKISKMTNDIIDNIDGIDLESYTINWDVKKVNNIEILVPSVEVKYYED